MTKQEKIKEVYGVFYKECNPDENGWTKWTAPERFSDLQFNAYKDLMRPLSLNGIEDNNGWIKLNGLANEISDRCPMWIMTKNGIEYLKENEFLPIGYATHYKPIEKPKPPIY